MTKKIKINFKDLTLNSFDNGNFVYDEVDNIEIDYYDYNPSAHGELDFRKLLKFKNIQTLSIASRHKENNDNAIGINLGTLLEFSSLKKVYLEGKNLSPYGLSSDWDGKGDFEISTKIKDIVFRMASFSNDYKKLTFEGHCINYFDNINFDEFILVHKEKLNNIEEVVLNDFNLKDQFNKGNIIDLSPFSKIKNLKKFSFHIEIDNSEARDTYFDFDTFPNFEKLESLQIEGCIKNYDFIKNLKNLKNLKLDRNWHDNQKFFSTNETRPLLNLRKIELGYPDLSLITDFSQNNKNFPNLEELSIEGVCMDDYLVNPIEISIFKNLKILRMSDSIFQDYKGTGSEEEYYKALDWCNSILIKND